MLRDSTPLAWSCRNVQDASSGRASFSSDLAAAGKQQRTRTLGGTSSAPRERATWPVSAHPVTVSARSLFAYHTQAKL